MPSALPWVEPRWHGSEYLALLALDPSPEIFQAAIEGIVQPGESEEIAVPRRAAEGTAFPRDRGALLEAARFPEPPKIDGGVMSQ